MKLDLPTLGNPVRSSVLVLGSSAGRRAKWRRTCPKVTSSAPSSSSVAALHFSVWRRQHYHYLGFPYRLILCFFVTFFRELHLPSHNRRKKWKIHTWPVKVCHSSFQYWEEVNQIFNMDNDNGKAYERLTPTRCDFLPNSWMTITLYEYCSMYVSCAMLQGCNCLTGSSSESIPFVGRTAMPCAYLEWSTCSDHVI